MLRIRTLVTQCCLDNVPFRWDSAQRTPAPPVFEPLCLWVLIVTAPAEHCCLVCHAAASRAEQQAAIARAQQSLEDAEAQLRAFVVLTDAARARAKAEAGRAKGHDARRRCAEARAEAEEQARQPSPYSPHPSPNPNPDPNPNPNPNRAGAPA